MWTWLLIACLPTRDDYEAVRAQLDDIDQDGDLAEIYGGTDCDDHDPDRSGQHDELCGNEIDDNCDGVVDGPEAVDASEWFYDGDQDGSGIDGVVERSCAPIDGYASSGGDCNDSDAAIHPGAEEICDVADVDEDCDGLADDLDDAVSGATTWYLDGDDDGYGTEETTEACDLPEGYAAPDGDCDDADPSVNPAAEEVCRNGVDDDCDGTYDGCGLLGEVPASDAAWSLRGEANSAYFGHHVKRACDLTLDGVEDFVVTAPGQHSGVQGAAYVFEGGSVPDSTDDAHAVIRDSEIDTAFGSGLVTCFDFEEDGRPDFLVVADDGENGLGGWGVAYVVNGASAGEVPLAWSSARILGDADSMGFVGVDVTQDITGDGIADLVIGDYLYPDGFDTPGKVWVLGLNPPGVPGGDLSLGDAQATILGQWDYSRTGTSATALGDIRHIDRLRLPGAGLWRLHSN